MIGGYQCENLLVPTVNWNTRTGRDRQRLAGADTASCLATISGEDDRSGTFLTTILLGSTYLILGCIQILPISTEPLWSIYLGQEKNKLVRHMIIVFVVRQIGYILGFLCGGFAFDYFVLPMEKQALFSFMLLVLALCSFLMPFFKRMIIVGIIFTITGISLKIVSTGINAYTMEMHGVNSNTGLQFIHACFLLGKTITLMGTRLDYQKFSADINITYTENTTHTPEFHKEMFTKLFISYSTVGSFTILLALAWISLFRFSPRKYRNNMPFDNSRQEKTTLGFVTLTVVSTLPMIITAFCLDFSYVFLLVTYATTKLDREVGEFDNAINFYRINNVFGRFIAVFVAYKLLSPFWMIILNIVGQILAACLMPLLNKFEDNLLWVVTGLVGLSSASLIPSTIAWLNSHIQVTGRIFGSMLAANNVILLAVPIVLNDTIDRDPEVPLYYMLVVPVFYATIFVIQVLLFRREQNLESSRALQEPRELQQIYRFQNDSDRHVTPGTSRNPRAVRRSYTVP